MRVMMFILPLGSIFIAYFSMYQLHASWVMH